MLRDDLVSIIEHNLKVVVGLGNQADGSTGIGGAIMDFVEWFGNQEMGRKWVICTDYPQTSNKNCTLVGNEIVDHSHVVGASRCFNYIFILD